MYALIKYVIFKANREVTNLLSKMSICSIFNTAINKSFGYKPVLFKCCIISYVSYIFSPNALKSEKKKKKKKKLAYSLF